MDSLDSKPAGNAQQQVPEAQAPVSPADSQVQAANHPQSLTFDELISHLGSEAQLQRLETERTILTSTVRRARIPNPVILEEPDVLTRIDIAAVKSFVYEANDRTGFFVPTDPEIRNFEFVAEDLIEAQFPDRSSTGPELSAALSTEKPKEGAYVYLVLENCVLVTDECDRKRKGRFRVLKIHLARTGFTITGIGPEAVQ